MDILKCTLSNNHVPAILLDYDDTIGGVQFPDGSIRPGAVAYDDVIERCLDVFEREGFDREVARKAQHDIDLTRAQAHGFGDKTRFAHSFREAYAWLGLTVPDAPAFDADVATELYRIGMSVFTDYPYAPLEGATDVVDRLARDFKIVIVTKGAVDEQEKKLAATGFLDLADDVFVVARKDVIDWHNIREAIGHLTMDHLVPDSWAIGNSAKADVNPLLRLGYNGIYIHGKNGWVFETEALEEPYPDRVAATVADIADVLTFFPWV